MLKASFEIITAAKKGSFVIKKFDKKGFLAPFHYHPEIELTYITEGRGKRFVGNNMTGFQESDLVMMGANLPHCWKLSDTKKANAGSFVIQFNYDFLGKDFFESAELDSVRKLIKRSEEGIEFKGKINSQAKEKIEQAFLEKNYRIIYLGCISL